MKCQSVLIVTVNENRTFLNFLKTTMTWMKQTTKHVKLDHFNWKWDVFLFF